MSEPGGKAGFSRDGWPADDPAGEYIMESGEVDLVKLYGQPLPAEAEYVHMETPLAEPSFTCPRCGRVSYSPDDIREGYCGYCHDWTGRYVHLYQRADGSIIPAEQLEDGPPDECDGADRPADWP